MDSSDESLNQLKIIYVGNLELSLLGKLDEIKNEFWKRTPSNEIKIYTNKNKNHVSLTYLFLTYNDAKIFGELLKASEINFEYHLESKFDELSTFGMNKKNEEKYFSTKLF